MGTLPPGRAASTGWPCPSGPHRPKAGADAGVPSTCDLTRTDTLSLTSRQDTLLVSEMLPNSDNDRLGGRFTHSSSEAKLSKKKP